ncbi:MAG: hypothetical protein Q7S02_01850, partial [bacterium]|nr:hypothetical protein [bacterium]
DGQGKCTNDATILCETDVVCGTGGTCDLCAGTPSRCQQTLISRSERAKPIVRRVCWNPATNNVSTHTCRSNADCNAPATCVSEGFAQSCGIFGEPVYYKITVGFRAISSAPDETKKITLSSPVAQVCSGPPWKPLPIILLPSP